MIKTTLKHFFYDISIDLLFNKLIDNFNVIDSNQIPRVGDFYKRASHIYGDEHYYNCVVKRVDVRGESDNPYHIICLTYEYSTGFDLDEFYNDSDMFDDEDEMIMIETSQTLADLVDAEDLEFVEGDGYIVLNSKYYTFHQ